MKKFLTPLLAASVLALPATALYAAEDHEIGRAHV